jgi:hypothetical protein
MSSSRKPGEEPGAAPEALEGAGPGADPPDLSEGFPEGATAENPSLAAALAARTVAPQVGPSAAEEARREALYRDIVKQEISFSRATGYDRESTAVVSLAELARREEARHRGAALDEDAYGEEETTDLQGDVPEARPRSLVLSVGQFIDVLRAAETVEEVAGVLVEVLARLVPRVLLLWERRGRLYGFASRGMDLTEVKLLTIEMPKGVFQQMAADELELQSFVGPPSREGMIQRFFDILGGAPAEVVVVPVQVTPEDRWLVYGDNRSEPLPELELRLLEVLAARAGARADWLLDRQSLW